MSGKSAQTIADIARLAGVSKSTVSRVLNGSPLIGTETSQRVRAILHEHGFQVNAAARRLSLGHSRTIAFVIHAYHRDFSVADLFVLEMMGSLFNELAAHGYDMLLIQADPDETAWVQQYLDSGRVEGFILLASTRRQEHIRKLVESGAPFVVWGAPPGEGISSVSGDNFEGGKRAVEYLIRQGRRRIGFLGGPAEELEIRQRFLGYQAALQAAGRRVEPALAVYQEYGAGAGAAGMERLLGQAPDVDAVFAISDLMAIDAIHVLQDWGRRVPEEVAVLGYDDLSIAQLSRPPLSSIRPDIPLAGRLLVQTLLEHLQSGVVKNITLPVELILRQSA